MSSLHCGQLMLTLDSVISTFKYCFKQGRQAECGHEKRVGKRSADTSWRHKEHSRRTPSDEPSTEVLPVPAPAPAPPETLPQLLAVAPWNQIFIMKNTEVVIYVVNQYKQMVTYFCRS